MPSERRWAMGKIGKGRAQLDPIWRENMDVQSGLWPEPWMAKDKSPSAAFRWTRGWVEGTRRQSGE